jgi:hypothetical protein
VTRDSGYTQAGVRGIRGNIFLRTRLSVHLRPFALARPLLALCLAVSVSGALAPGAFAAATPARGYLYKVEFEGEGIQNVKDADGSGDTIEQHATWTIKPEPAEIWLPQVTEPRGPGNELKTTAGSSAKLSPSGQVVQTGTYADSPSPGSYECNGPIEDNVAAKDTVEVGPYATEDALTTDFFGTFIAGSGKFGNEGGAGSCDTDPEKGYEPQYGSFLYFWDPEMPTSESNQRMEVGDLIPPQDVGLSSFGLVAQDYSYVNQSLGCQYNAPGSGCTLEFHITGSYELTLQCGGTVENGSSGTGGCGGSGAGSSSNEPKKEAEKPAGSGNEKPTEKVAEKSQLPTAGTLVLSEASAKGETVEAKVACTGSASAKCIGSSTLTAVRTVRKKLHGHVHSVRETVTVASADVSLTAPDTQTLELTLNGAGKALLEKSHKLAVTLELATTSSGPPKTVASKKLALTIVKRGLARHKPR